MKKPFRWFKHHYHQIMSNYHHFEYSFAPVYSNARKHHREKHWYHNEKLEELEGEFL